MRWSGGEWRLAPHLDLLSREAAHVADRPVRLIVSLPVRHGKSLLLSVWPPIWLLSNWPGKRVILASYEASFAASWGRKTRNIVLANPGIGVRLAQDSASQSIWETTESGGMVTAGVGGPITGRGADLLIIDDPVRNRQDADSPVVRQGIWEWWESVARTRLEPNASVIVVMSRWDSDDLVGRLLRQPDDIWTHIRLPAVAESGDALGRPVGAALWPERYPLPRLRATEREVGPDAWAGLYQQRPNPQGRGLFFDVDAVERCRGDIAVPVESRLGGLVSMWKRPVVGRRYVAGGDLAWGEKGAFSCLVVADHQTGEVVAELHGRPRPDEMAQVAVALCREYGNAYVGVERNGEGVVVVDKMRELGYGNRMFWADHEARVPERCGWQTDARTRPMMLGELEEAVRVGAVRVHCRDAVSEMGTFVRDERGRPGPNEGTYGDHVMALAVMWQMRKWATFSVGVGVGAAARSPAVWAGR